MKMSELMKIFINNMKEYENKNFLNLNLILNYRF